MPEHDSPPLTHFFHCWRLPGHHTCAVALIERQAKENDQMLTAAVNDPARWQLTVALTALRRIDTHLDDTAPDEYKAQPLAWDWARTMKVCSEAGEVEEALTALTGANYRKGTCGTLDDLLGELGDVVVAALGAIQHQTKSTEATWGVVMATLAKGFGRVTAHEAALESDQAAWGGRIPPPGYGYAEWKAEGQTDA